MGKETEPRHPIGVVSTRTGIPQDVLRAWERRYEAVVPHRTDTGRRLYSDADLRKFRLLKAAVDSGRRISDVAGLSLKQLDALASEDREETRTVRPAARSLRPGKAGARDAAAYLAGALEAVAELDGDRLRRTISEASVTLSAPALRKDLLCPLMREIGERWRDGTMRIANEHLATAVVRSFLASLRGRSDSNGSGPRVVISTPSGDLHEFGALLAAECAAEVGWNPVYLGPDLPAEEIAAAVRQTGARVVALSLVLPRTDAEVRQELRKLGDLLGDGTPLVVGGGSAPVFHDVLAEIGATRIEELADFQGFLEEAARR